MVFWRQYFCTLTPDRACPALYLEEVLGYDREALRVVSGALQVRVLVQHIVVDVQEEL